MCPALIFAANRTEIVPGRTTVLTVSTTTKKGFSQLGAPLGNNLAMNALGEFIKLEMIKENHKGSPKIKLNTICLEKLNLYGNNPKKLIIINMTNKEIKILLNPLIWNKKVRVDCVAIPSIK